MKEAFVGFWIIVLIVLVVLSPFLISIAYQKMTIREIDCFVKDKERIVNSDDSYYLVFCEEIVLKNSDSLWNWKWNSSDIYKDLDVEKSYKLKVYGWRMPILSWYPNIISII